MKESQLRQSADRFMRAALAVVEGLECRTLLSAGAIDPTFGVGGTLTLPDTASISRVVSAMVVQPNGKFIVGGSYTAGTQSGFYLARYNSSGSLDKTFGNQGSVRTPGLGAISRLLLQPDGKIVAGGDADHTGIAYESVTYGHRLSMARYNSNGALDATFANKGTLVTMVGSGEIVTGLANGAAGRVLVSIGETNPAPNTSRAAAL